ncbi:protein kinase [Sorangium cellulosum]|uniref:Protein kinase n=1 Tax=Sorangium cellulosum TaxID=56 RepID=A0A2L0ER00_SORCE|nr:bifunctional serine/threonine-protein kinase/formylglycine-generating enzyme family protein [Sorangium cellulosum]AUX41729.1 protein kinase [Sorangium cellulosum]
MPARPRRAAKPRPPKPRATPTTDETLSLSPSSGLTAELRELPVASPWTRYEDLGVLGSGSMGEVHRVRDRLLGRTLAMKILAVRGPGAMGFRARFLAEARLAAGLQHPGIVPVHDCGATPEGRLYFTMDEVRGQTLRAAIEAAHRAEPGGPSPAALRRLADVYLRVCEAVAHAHRSGVIHRDLKPDNVMLGDLGEVLVVDWGLARALAAIEAPAGSGGALGGPRLTHAGHVLGTPAYMPPEQARGLVAEIDQRSDVHALGAILYEILCGAPPYEGPGRAVLARVVAGPPPPVARRAAGALPAELVAACERAMARAPGDRFADAGALAEEVRAFLDGAHRRDRALALVREARAIASELGELQARARALRAEAAAILGQIETYDPAERKARGWALEDEARALEVTAAVDLVAFQTRLHAALVEVPDLPEAHAALADLHTAELAAAEAARDPAAAARAEALVAQHHQGRLAALLDGRGAVSIATSPEGAEVWAFRYVERARRLTEEPLGLLGRTPIRDVALPRGSYLLRVRAPGHVEARIPVHLGRGERFLGVRPGDADPFVIPLLPEGALGADEVYIPAGWFSAGGDPAAAESLPAQRVWVDGVIVGRDPVTVAAYLAFLNDLVAEGREAEAEAACPCLPRSRAGGARVPLLARGVDDGRYTPPELPAGDLGRMPIVSVTWRGATAYAAWRSARTGQAFRLVGELEREKAARGVDGRYFPWGDQPEPTWACMAGSTPGAPGLAPVDVYPTDESPYGVRGLAGNVRDWCAEAWTQAGPPVEGGVLRVAPAPLDDPSLRSIRGGVYYGPSQLCRAAGRFAARPEEHGAGVGLRLARPVGPARARG